MCDVFKINQINIQFPVQILKKKDTFLEKNDFSNMTNLDFEQTLEKTITSKLNNINIKNIIIVLIFSLFSSCSNKDTLCHNEQSKAALQESIIESIKEQAIIIDKQDISQLELQLRDLFRESNIQLNHVSLISEDMDADSNTTCTCGTRMSFADEGAFLKAVGPKVSALKEKNDKYSNEYLKNKHLMEYYEKQYYPFFFTVIETKEGISASPHDYKVASLLLDYLKFLKTNEK
ncbi:hypothetical protein B879_00168 [Cecembia lonarensis LW9]|uniref:Uncharacterized protein n=2 Tax=Cecembia TaxID=1187078 RepID=K1LG06_CECL9|nr:hypothetical protein B879_00168 [Cecembia lonarensis LW9]